LNTNHPLLWVLANIFGEALGMAAVAVGFFLVQQNMAGPEAIAGAGLIEGFMLGVFQFWAGRKVGLRGTAWVGATMLAGLVGYGLVGLAMASHAAPLTDMQGIEPVEPALWLIGLLGAGMGLVLGGIFGFVQCWALPRRVPKGRWVWRNAIGWSCGMAIIMVAASTVPEGAGLDVVAVRGLLAGGLAGLCLGLATLGALQVRQLRF